MYFRLGFNVNIKKIKTLLLWLLLQVVSSTKPLAFETHLHKPLEVLLAKYVVFV